MEIIPAIIPQSFEDLKQKFSLVRGKVSAVQIDIVDGVFVPSKGWPYLNSMWESGIFLEVPKCDACVFEFDLMIDKPEEKIQDFIDAGASRIVVHVESTEKLNEIVEKFGDKVELGLAFNIYTNPNDYRQFFDKISFIQFMGIERIGYQGEVFTDLVLPKIAEFRKNYPDMTISVDGGVNLDNAKLLKDAGASRIASGSTIFGSEDIDTTIEVFKRV